MTLNTAVNKWVALEIETNVHHLYTVEINES